MIVSICLLSYLDPTCMVGRIYGTTSCGSHGFREDALKFFPHFKSIEAYGSMAIIDTRIMDGRIYVGNHKVKKKCKDQESIHSSTTPDPKYQWESDNFTIRHLKREPIGQPFPSR